MLKHACGSNQSTGNGFMTDEIIAVSGIYTITHKINGRVYVGSAVNLKKRWSEHRTELAKNRHRNQKLQHAYDKYGKDMFVFSVVESVENIADLLAREQYWIDSLDAVEVGYNISPIAGSRLGVKMTEESCARMRVSATGKIISPEHRASLSKAMTGYKHTPEHNENCRIARTGLKIPKISEALRGRKRSAETIERQRASLTGRKQPGDEIARRTASMTGLKRTDEARENMSNAQKGHIVSDEARAKLRAANIGKKQSQETIEKRKKSILARRAAM